MAAVVSDLPADFADSDLYRLVTAHPQDLICLIDQDGCYVFVNPPYHDMLGREPHTLTGQLVQSVIHPQDAPHLTKMLQDIWLHGHGQGLLRYQHVHGPWRWIETNGMAMEWGDRCYALCFGRNVSDRVWHEESRQFLVEASDILFASLDFEATLTDVARLAVPRVADYCVIGIVEADGALRHIQAAHTDPAKHEQLAQIIATLSHVYSAKVLRDRQAILAPRITQKQLDALVLDEEQAAIIRELHPRSALLVPMVVRDQVVGVIALVMSISGRVYGTQDLDVMTDLARRAAQAVDNARLYHSLRESHRNAERALQHVARLQAVTTALSHTLTPQQVAGVIISQGLAAVEADAGSVFLLVNDDQYFRALDHVGYPTDLHQHHVYISADRPGPLRDVLQTRDLVITESAELLSARWPHLVAAQRRSGDMASIAAPLLLEERVLGVLYFAFRREHQFCAEERNVVTTLARQCAQALERAQLYVAEREARVKAERTALRTSALQQITAALSSALTPAQVADVVVRQGITAMGAYAGTVIVYQPEQQIFETVAHIGYPSQLMEKWRTFSVDAKLPVVDAVRHNQPLWIADRDQYCRDYPHLTESLNASTVALTALPLITNGQAFGALGLSFDTPQAFDAEDRAYLLALAQQCSQAMERANLYAQSQAQTLRLTVLADASQAFALVSLNLPVLLDTITRRVAEGIGDLATIGLISDNGELLELASIYHTDPEAQRMMADLLCSFPQRVDEGLSKEPLRTGKPLRISVFPMEQLRAVIKPEYAPYLDQYGIHSLMIAPLRVQNRVLGTLGVLRGTPGRPYSKDDLVMLQELADRAALAIENARLYEAAQDAVRLRDQFLQVSSHELKTPLTTMLGNVQLMQRRAQREGDLSERYHRSLQVIELQSRRLSTLVNELLDISRIQRGQFAITPAPLDLPALIRRVVQEVRPSFEPQFAITLSGDDRPIWVHGDALRLDQVMHNLITNAIKYSPQGGTVEIQLSSQNGNVLVAVSDHGIGIPQEALPKLFTRFYRAPNVNPQQISGMGIGLYVVKEIVGLHRGHVNVESVEGYGSTFTISLPILPVPPTGDRVDGTQGLFVVERGAVPDGNVDV